jgi:N-acetyl-anhydromuramyl-L-alanine amidase AmpD
MKLELGALGPEIGNWQRFLNEAGFRDFDGLRLKEDEVFGARTRFATAEYQASKHLPREGAVNEATRALAVKEGFIPFLLAKNFTSGEGKGRQIDVIVIHDMEYPKKMTAALEVARWFSGGSAPQASAHYCVDAGAIIQCVRDRDIAWHAPGANKSGIGIEHAGYARQSKEEWLDEYGRRMLERSAWLAKKLCRKYGIPILRLSPEALLTKQRGFAGHADVTLAFSKGKGHTDPGPYFPWSEYLEMVESAGELPP